MSNARGPKENLFLVPSSGATSATDDRANFVKSALSCCSYLYSTPFAAKLCWCLPSSFLFRRNKGPFRATATHPQESLDSIPDLAEECCLKCVTISRPWIYAVNCVKGVKCPKTISDIEGGALAWRGILFWLKETAGRTTSRVASKRRPLIYFMLHCIAICVRNRAIRHWKKLMIRSLRQGKPNIIYIIFNILVVISSLERK